MKDPIADAEHQVEILLAEAVKVASSHKVTTVGPDHLLFVVAGTEEGRRAIEVMGGRADRAREFLVSVFRFCEDGHDEQKLLPRASHGFSNALQQVVNRALTKARTNYRPVTLRNLIQEMIALRGECETTRRALVAAGLVEAADPTASGDDFRLDEEVESGTSGVDEPDSYAEQQLADAPEAADAQAATPEAEQPVEPAPEPGSIEAGLAAAVDEHEKAVWRAMRDLKAEARAGEIEPAIARDEEIEQMIQGLSKRRKANILLVGEAGVGKSAVVEGFACAMVEREDETGEVGRPIYEVSLSDMVAGARFRGDFESRMTHLVRIARAKNAILFMDEFHMVMGAGSATARGGMDAANILKPALARGQLSLIGATTPTELRVLRKDAPMMRRFDILRLEEPSAETTRAIIDTAVGGYVLHHEVMMDDTMLDAVIDFAERYMPHRRFPDKAFDLIDVALVSARQRGADMAEIDDLRTAVSRLGGVRLGRPDRERTARVLGLGDSMRLRLKGQEKAIEKMAQAAAESLFGLQSSSVAACYLLNGPSGVGKSEAVEAYAEALGLPLVRISLSEFIEKHAVARLIGAPPGYVGFDEEGLLTSAGETYRECVIFFDEADKAHPDIFDILLQVLDKGVLRAGDGREVSMRGCHIFLASNFGAAQAERGALGFGRQNDASEAATEAMKATFRREFMARIRHVIQFEAIGNSVVRDIARTKLELSARRLRDAGYRIVFTDGVVDHVVNHCPNLENAGRSIEAAISAEITSCLARAMLETPDALEFQVDIVDGEVRVEADCAA